jgi:hypothetical protein
MKRENEGRLTNGVKDKLEYVKLKKCTVSMEGHEGIAYDCSGIRQANQLTKTTNQTSGYVD